MSDGFDFYILEQLERSRVPRLRVSANRARFEDGGLTPEFPHAGGCGRCGNCKAAHARHARARGFRTCAVGNGWSDRCMAREADQVFACGSLLEWCRAEGLGAYDRRAQSGLLRNLVIREGRRTGDLQVRLVTSAGGAIDDDGFAAVVEGAGAFWTQIHDVSAFVEKATKKHPIVAKLTDG